MAFQRLHPAALVVFAAIRAVASDPIQLPNGFSLALSAAPHSVMIALNPGISARRNFTLGQAVTTALSPDGAQLLVLTSGYNREILGKVADFPEFVFVYTQLVCAAIPYSLRPLHFRRSRTKALLKG